MARIGSAAFTPPVRSRLRRLKVSYWRERLFTGGVNAALPIGAQDKMPKNYPKEITRRKLPKGKLPKGKLPKGKLPKGKLLVRNYS